ncbi:MAG: hypothetical protein JO041_08790 [Acidobacteria bacterium]|nr:hypothetical protein [Acidobacteriota bacterium]
MKSTTPKSEVSRRAVRNPNTASRTRNPRTASPCPETAARAFPHRATVCLPGEVYRLEEINLPAPLAEQLAGQPVQVNVYPEEPALSRKLDSPLTVEPTLIMPDGTIWNDLHPTMATFDADGQQWRLPRRWLQSTAVLPQPDAEQERHFTETLHLPNFWDLEDINIYVPEANKAGGQPAEVSVRLAPGQRPRVEWRDSSGTVWRIPHDWRRRRIILPSSAVLVAQGIPEDVAHVYAGRVVAVNYHPGSLCCLEDGYRFRDEFGNRWPVPKAACVVLGFGLED